MLDKIIATEGLPLVERNVVDETWCDDIASVEIVGTTVKFTFYSLQKACDGTMEKVVVAKIVRPVQSLANGRAMIQKALVDNRRQGLGVMQ